MSGARISSREQLESQSAQRRVGGDSLRLGDRARTSEILDRYSRDSGRSIEPERGVAERSPAPARDTGTGLSSARRAGSVASGRDAAAPPVASRDSAGRSSTDRGRATPERTAGGLTTERRSAGERTAANPRSRSGDARDPVSDRAGWQKVRERYNAAKQRDPDTARKTETAGRTAGIATDVAFRSALSTSGIVTGVPSQASVSVGAWSSDLGVSVTVASNASCWYWYGWYPSFCWSWWGSGCWWSFCWSSCSWYYPYYSYGYPYGWCYPYYYQPYYPYYYSYYYPVYAYSPPVVYSTVYYGDTYYEDGASYEGGASYEAGASVPEEAAPAAQAEIAYPPQPASPGGAEQALVMRATSEYLSLGDRAFREGGYGRAVRYYAKAVEYSPNDGVLYLILCDALFATGDYHYAAYALRRALELDPELSLGTVDKRQFYGDPADFDRQLALLESYLADHFLDDDARLVLAANYLFGGAPERCVELMENAFSLAVRESEAGVRVLAAARAALDAKKR